MSNGLLREVIREIISQTTLCEAIKNDAETRIALEKVANQTLVDIAEQNLGPAVRAKGWTIGIDEQRKKINFFPQSPRLASLNANRYQKLFDDKWLETLALNAIRPTEKELKVQVGLWLKEAFERELLKKIEPGWVIEFYPQLPVPGAILKKNFQHEMHELGVEFPEQQEPVDTGTGDPLDFTSLGLTDASTNRHKANGTRVWEDPQNKVQVFLRTGSDGKTKVALKLPQWSGAQNRGTFSAPQEVRARVIELLKNARSQVSSGSNIDLGVEVNGTDVLVVSVPRNGARESEDTLLTLIDAINDAPARVFWLLPGSAKQERIMGANIDQNQKVTERSLENAYRLTTGPGYPFPDLLFIPNPGVSTDAVATEITQNPDFSFHGVVMTYTITVSSGRIELRRKSVA